MQKLTELLVTITKLKTQIDHYRPLSKAQVIQLEKNIRIEHVWSSSTIEGNQLNQFETASILNKGLTIHGAAVKDILEVLDLNQAYEYMLDLAKRQQPLTQTIIRDLNRLATLQTAENRADAGVYRAITVWPNGLENHPYVDPFSIRPQMDALITWANETQKSLHPVIYAARLHQRFVAIHPFIDGNGRTARLLMNLALTEAGYPVINVQPAKASRDAYMLALEKARNGVSADFDQLIAHYMLTTLQQRLRILQLNQQNIADAEHDV
ncbi:Fic family protein [Loigolactobacillus jiayinensis]|uniref:Fic family protein n=1 Tax=Loigolactobacillus jiayinensis TaxID=2486016 RepID=A0ABW1RCP1_9LACO|nr:Fic family protein [Loigolactobacillus jiayinensis]